MTGKLRRFGRDRSAASGQDDATDATRGTAGDSSADPAGAGAAPEVTTPEPVEERTAAPDGPAGDRAAADGGTDPDEVASPEHPTGAAPGTGGSAEAVEVSAAATTRARPARRATPAASAASRARRIGGVRTGAPTPSGDVDDLPPRPTPRVSTTKPSAGRPARGAGSARGAAPAAAADRTASARALKDEARGSSAGGVTVVTQVPRWLRWAPAAVLGACAIVMAVVLAVSSHGVWWSVPSAQQTRDQVLAAAKQCTALTNTYAWNTIPADEKKGKACTTGAQSQRYVSAMENIVKPTAPKLHASQTVQINTAGIESIAPNGAQWTVVIFGQTTIRQTGATPRVDPFSTVVRMDHVHGAWLVSSICLITAPNGSQAASC